MLIVAASFVGMMVQVVARLLYVVEEILDPPAGADSEGRVAWRPSVSAVDDPSRPAVARAPSSER